MAGQTNCESCANYVYDEESDCYCCEVDLDEDEMYRFLSDTFTSVRIISWTTNIGS